MGMDHAEVIGWIKVMRADGEALFPEELFTGELQELLRSGEEDEIDAFARVAVGTLGETGSVMVLIGDATVFGGLVELGHFAPVRFGVEITADEIDGCGYEVVADGRPPPRLDRFFWAV